MRLGLGHGGAIDRMNEPISGALGRLTARCGQAFLTIRAELLTHYRRALARLRLWLRPELSHAIAAAAPPPISRALVKFTAESSKVILALPGRGRARRRRRRWAPNGTSSGSTTSCRMARCR